MSDDYLARLKAEHSDVDWDALMAAARKRRKKSWTPYQRVRHWLHVRRHGQLHEQHCSVCRASMLAVGYRSEE